MKPPRYVVLINELPGCPIGTIFRLHMSEKYYYNNSNDLNLKLIGTETDEFPDFIADQITALVTTYKYESYSQEDVKQYTFDVDKIVENRDSFFYYIDTVKSQSEFSLIAFALSTREKLPSVNNKIRVINCDVNGERVTLV